MLKPLSVFVIITMALAVLMFIIIIVIASSRHEHKDPNPTLFPTIVACCLGGIVMMMASMVAFLLSQGYGQYLFVS